MFTGEHERSLDDKGRMVLPVAWRPEFASGGHLALSGDRTFVELISDAVMRETAERLIAGVREGRYSLRRQRAWARSLTSCTPDGQGRIIIPPHLRDAAGIDRQLLVIGNLNRIEIWNPDRYDPDTYEEADDESPSETVY